MIQEKFVGVSELRKMTTKYLREQESVNVVVSGAQPVAAIIPYEMFIAVQALRKKLEKGAGQ